MENTNPKLIKAIRSGDEQAFEQLFFRYYEPLVRFACHYTNSRASAEGLVQDVFANVWEKREELEPNTNIRSYLYTSVKNSGLDQIRHEEVVHKYRDEVKIELYIHHQESSGERITKKGFTEATQNAIEALPDQTRHIYKLSRKDGLTYSEIADILGLSVKSIEYHISKALQFLRNHLSDYLPALYLACVLYKVVA